MAYNLHLAISHQDELCEELWNTKNAKRAEVKAAMTIFEILDWKRPLTNPEFQERKRKGALVPADLVGNPDVLPILHFNDVYHIESRDKEPVGGAARFGGLIRDLGTQNPGMWVLFSGDVFAPSLMSTVTKGAHMVPVLNHLEIKAALFGNHDFEFGVEKLEKMAGQCVFPWFMSNVYDRHTGEPLGGGIIKQMYNYHGHKIGLIGLVEEEWLTTLTTIEPDDVDYRDFVTEGRKLACELRADGADMVIAMTHSREHNDIRLAEEVDEIDLILGGHDHYYSVQEIGSTLVVKSGCDFRECSLINVHFGDDGSISFEHARHEVTSQVRPDKELKAIVDAFADDISSKMDTVVGFSEVALDTRVKNLRAGEVNIGNMIADIMKHDLNTDCALINSGSIRADDTFGPGPIRIKDLMNILPSVNVIVVLELSGAQILAALENGVSQYPAHEGRFPQVSGIRFEFAGSAESGSRVVDGSVSINDEPLDMEKLYTIATTSYLAGGKDGFDVFAEGRVVVDDEDGPMLNALIRNYFTKLKVVNRLAVRDSTHRAVAKFKKTIHKHTEGDDVVFKANPQTDGRITRVD